MVLQSKRFWTFVFSAVVMLLVSYFPELQSSEESLISALVAITIALIGGYSLQDIVNAIGTHSVAFARITKAAIDKYESTGRDFPDPVQELIENRAK